MRTLPPPFVGYSGSGDKGPQIPSITTFEYPSPIEYSHPSHHWGSVQQLSPTHSRQPTLMAHPPTMALPRLSASRSKKEFLEHLGINENEEAGRRIYRDMMDEAALSRERMCSDRMNLAPHIRDNPDIKPPYSSNMIVETVMYGEVHRIYTRASPVTKEQYDKGNYMDGSNWDNWVIRWCIWHVFRYRDDRNRNRNQRNSGLYSRSSNDEDSVPTSPRSPQENGSSFRGSYDPVRNAYR